MANRAELQRLKDRMAREAIVTAQAEADAAAATARQAALDAASGPIRGEQWALLTATKADLDHLDDHDGDPLPASLNTTLAGCSSTFITAFVAAAKATRDAADAL